MSVRLLGTGSADGWPSAFCGCASCETERAAGRCRTQTSALIDDVLLVDCGPTTAYAAERAGVRLDRVRILLFTHQHSDHFSPATLMYRSWVDDSPLTVVGPPDVIAACRPWLPEDAAVTFCEVVPEDTLQIDGFTLGVLAAAHRTGLGDGTPDAVLYDVTTPGRERILFATDTGPLPEETLAATAGAAYDVVLLEETFGDTLDHGTDHLDLATFPEQVRRLIQIGAVVDGTDLVAVHLSHHNPPATELSGRLAACGARLVDDGELLVPPLATSVARRARRTPAATLGIMLATVLVVAFAGIGPAQAIDQDKGHPGFCEDDKGVTVVVDFGTLGGQPIVRCDPRTSRGTGLDALKGAGFQIAGVQRWGESFICRIENRPSAVEKLAIAGNDGYRETCVDTPPAAGYWSYWHAGNNCAWEYSQWGVKNRDVIPGGFEGWSFSLNAKADDNPKPRIAAVRPGTEGGACNAPDQGSPTSDDPDERAPGAQPTTAPTGNSADGDLPAPKPREVTEEETPDDPAGNVAFGGGEDAPDVNDTLEEQSGASRYAPWVAGAVVVILAVTMWLTARRRRRTREA